MRNIEPKLKQVIAELSVLSPLGRARTILEVLADSRKVGVNNILQAATELALKQMEK